MTPDLIAAGLVAGVSFGLLCVGFAGLGERRRARKLYRTIDVRLGRLLHREQSRLRKIVEVRRKAARAALDAQFDLWKAEALRRAQ